MKKIVIEIADDDYNRINSYPDGTTFYPITARLYKAVKNGQILPKGHGRLIDADEVEKLEEALCATECDCCGLDGCFYDEAETIIEADERRNRWKIDL